MRAPRCESGASQLTCSWSAAGLMGAPSRSLSPRPSFVPAPRYLREGEVTEAPTHTLPSCPEPRGTPSPPSPSSGHLFIYLYLFM